MMDRPKDILSSIYGVCAGDLTDREKVEKGLRICTSTEPCNGCPYLNERNCSLSMVADALKLLNEQEGR